MKKELIKDSKSVFKKGESKMPKISVGGFHIKLFSKDLWKSLKFKPEVRTVYH